MRTRPPPKTSADAFGPHVPGTLVAGNLTPGWTDVLVEIYARRRVEESLLVPAVAEPLLVWVLSGTARVEERELGGGPWSGRVVTAGEFFLTTTPQPYELRWTVTGPEPLKTLHAYVGLPVFARVARAMVGSNYVGELPALREVFGGRDPILSALLGLLRTEVEVARSATPAGALFVGGLAQSLAVHLLRTYPATGSAATTHGRRGGLPAFKLRRVTDYLEAHLAEEISLARLAREAGLSPFHFSRLFKRTTGFSPSQYLIRRRLTRARCLLRETTRPIIEIGLEVGYTSPSHFAQIFRREAGVTPSEYRDRL